MNKDQYISDIFEELEKLRKEFNTIVYPDYYRLAPQKELLKVCFINNCLTSPDVELHAEELQKAVYLDETIRFFEGELRRIDPKLIRTPFDLDSLHFAINDLISVMVPNDDLVNQKMAAFDQAAQSLKNRNPILFIEEDLIDAFCPIFHQAVRHLQHIFDYQPAELKAIYAACQIRHLNYLQVNAQRNGRALNLCITNLKKIFQGELQNKIDQDRSRQLPIEHFMVKEKDVPATEPLSFGYKKSPGFLTPFIHALNNRIDFLDKRTSEDDFIRIATSEDLGTITEKIYLGCQTNEFKYLIKRLQPFFKSFNPATIGKSGLFISNLGNPITSENLYNSDIENLPTKIAIDTIFNQKH